MKSSNISEICKITGFSPATVSNALNSKKGVNVKTAEVILNVAQTLGYFSHIRIDNIILVKFKKSGKVLIDSPLIAELLEGVETEGRECGLDTIIFNIEKDEPDFPVKISRLLNERNSGMILLATEMDWDDIAPFANVSMPIVVVDAWFKEGRFDTVLMNNTDSLYQSVSYLVEKGHKDIGFIGSAIEIRNFFYREQGFRSALAGYGLRWNDAYSPKLEPTMTGAYEDMLRYLEKEPALPTAYVVVNDIIAFGVMKALQEKGIRIPEDVSIIGFDNMPFSGVTTPALTTIDIYKKEMGQFAVRRLMTRAAGIAAPAKFQLLTQLVERASVKQL